MSIQLTEISKRVVVFDIDGCLVESNHRLDHLLQGDRATYDALHPQDTTIPAGVVVYSALLKDPHLECVFVTSRNESCRDYTERQLMHALGPCVTASKLLMRANRDEWIPDVELKPRLLAEAGYTLDQVLLVVEDSAAMNAYWRSHGITCWQTKPDSAKHWTPPAAQTSK
jgi:phosphoglycolate phosphatase-like HAD superfamily hydrolase